MNNLPEVVVLAGGIGQRFRQSGLTSTEKPLIKVHGASQIVWALLGVAHSYPGARVYIASRSGLVEPLRTELEGSVCGLITEFVDIGEATLGAAHSLKLFIENSKILDRNSQLISCDNDCLSIVSRPKTPYFVSVMRSVNPGHCFVSTNKNGQVQRLHEKSVVGSLALSGHYSFASSLAYLDFYTETIFHESEFFLSRVVEQVVNSSVMFDTVVCDYHFSLGTPSEIQSADPKIIQFDRYNTDKNVETNL